MLKKTTVQEREEGWEEKGQQRLPLTVIANALLGPRRRSQASRRCTIFDAAISTSALSCSTSQLPSSSSVSPSFSMQNSRTQDRRRGQGKRRQRDWTRGERIGAYASDGYASDRKENIGGYDASVFLPKRPRVS